MSQGKQFEISWTQFELCNANQQTAFENMCRWLFNEFFFDGKELLHSDPNNPGVEVVPVYHVESEKWISFQSKYFSAMDYEQIKHSARAAVSHYAGQLDIIYLYCNKDVTTSSQGYQAVESILSAHGIEIVPITNQEILTQVMKSETIAWHFFDYFTLSDEWLKNRLEASLASLGPRYNDEFNVQTNTEMYLNYFLCNADAVTEINRIKSEQLQSLKKNHWIHADCRLLRNKLISTIEAIPDISLGNILDCLSWPDTIKSACASEFEAILQMIKAKEKERTAERNKNNFDKSNKITNEINEYKALLHVPERIIPALLSCALMRQQILVVRGDAGVGKSQMVAVAAEKLVSNGYGAILLLGTDYLSNNTILTQTPEVLGVDLPVEALLHKLEALAIQNKTYSYIFIDAINESTYKNIWKPGLPLLITKLKNYPHIKLAVSIRTGYEKMVLNEAVRNGMDNGEIGNLVHQGFREESIDATLTFLNHYGIPFLPSYFLQAEMTNPLFLSLYCKNYTGENFDMYSLFERVIDKADREAQEAVEIDDSIPLLQYLIDEIASIRLASNSIQISQSDLFDLGFWNRYGLADKKIKYVTSLIRSGFLIVTPFDDTEWYSLGYNLLEDFVCAKSILRKYSRKEDLIPYLCNELLQIENGSITRYSNIDIAIIVCGLYADANREECFEDVEQNVTDDNDRYDLDDRYLKSFLWRKASSVDGDDFLRFINNHAVRRDAVFRVLIENSTKEHHPLNALFLHEILINRTPAKRDSLWTTFINHLVDDEERLFQLITYFDEGHLLDGLSAANTELILILLTWLLTSSNRFLRDKASKAAIELLKWNFGLCKSILQRFEKVNDPYVLQRLYGIVFGACVKRTEPKPEIFRELAEYVYSHIFDKEYVYPDVLLRDYARLIVERWLYENPDDSSCILTDRIKPPYKSEAIPIVEKQIYKDDESLGGGVSRIYFSMQINHADCPGMYGDFGRYTFQSALEHFDGVDIVNMYHYAMQYIRDELGYDEKLSDYDGLPKYHGYNRHDTRKVERIGKKYQWIALYNILARVSDTYLVKNWGGEPYPFEGPWEPYVRDFDPTLNVHFLQYPDAPAFERISNDVTFLDSSPSAMDIDRWKEAIPGSFNAIPARLSIQDTSGDDWIALITYECAKKNPDKADDRFGIPSGTQEIWYKAQAYFMKSTHFQLIKKHIESPQFSLQDFPEGGDVYQLFNREYAWSPGFKSVFRELWLEHEIETGEYRTVTEVYEVPDFENIEYDDEGNMQLRFVEKTYERQVPEDIIPVPIMPAYSRVLWEEEYDASQEETTAFYIPCGKLVEDLHLHQKKHDGYYYTQDGMLACFDGNLAGVCDGLLIRADLLKKFLQMNDLMMFWSCIGEKQYFFGDYRQEWSRWSGCYHFEDDQILGNMIQHGSI